MRWRHYHLTAPFLADGNINEAEVFGSAVWLWMHSAQHRDAPLHTLPDLLLPIVKARQFVIASRGDQPVFFLSWMWLDAEAEQRYLTQPAIFTRQQDWQSGDRLWIRDWIAPFGDTPLMRQFVLQELFPHHCFRAQYHRGAERGQRILDFHGSQVSRAAAHQWRQQQPAAVTPSRRLSQGQCHE
ncbi:toxin-activating lysine-acyltransferase [Pantoea eucrina]|uniref:RTX toxin-activating lysine-acyltransferase n=1 Tax=Pantoea eucrina TaxID=472693 RepID=A0ABU5LBC5_9GAMM|nr:toxin-activating lysine-acyltransferase [Pantoea eucrina]MDZ7277220.1 toxin-activating lysine-acyltransferase [Pantoea eucrina]